MRAVVVTRDEPPDGPLTRELTGLGLSVLAWPVLKVAAPKNSEPLEQALGRARSGGFDWIVFASQHAVRAVTSRLPAPPTGARVAAVGARTAQALAEAGWRVDLTPATETAEGLVEAMTSHMHSGARILFPASTRALPTLAAGLRQLGAQVEQVDAYDTQGAALDVKACREPIEQHAIGAVTLTSPSGVEELERILGRELFDRLFKEAPGVTLGPTTAQALSRRGYRPVLAEPATLAGLAATTQRLLSMRH